MCKLSNYKTDFSFVGVSFRRVLRQLSRRFAIQNTSSASKNRKETYLFKKSIHKAVDNSFLVLLPYICSEMHQFDILLIPNHI